MKRIKISFIFNIIISILMILGLFIMFFNLKFMPGKDLLTTKGIAVLKYFTVLSNILVGIISLLFAYNEYLFLKNKKTNISNKIYILKMVGTVSVSITFLVTLLYLAPSIDNGFYLLYRNSNLFFHLIIPLLSIISFIFFEKNKIKFKYTFLSLIPIILYGIYYVTNILVHVENNSISKEYDFYGFVQGDISSIGFVFIFLLVIAYLVTLLIWFLNKRNK